MITQLNGGTEKWNSVCVCVRETDRKTDRQKGMHIKERGRLREVKRVRQRRANIVRQKKNRDKRADL